MQVQHIRTAVKLAQSGHYQTAANALFLHRKTVYSHIRQLEQELGFSIFQHEPGEKDWMLTEQGTRWLVLARRAMGLLDQAAVEVKKGKGCRS